MPTVIERADNQVNRACAVGVGGKIAYHGGPGPRGFKPGEVAEWL